MSWYDLVIIGIAELKLVFDLASFKILMQLKFSYVSVTSVVTVGLLIAGALMF